MNAAERVRAKLASCRPYYSRLLELRKELGGSAGDWRIWSMIERNLQLSLECAIDVGEMVISWKGWERPEENRDVFRILGKEGAIPEDLARRMMAAAGLRNILVHQYGDLDRERIRKALTVDLDDIDSYARAIAALVA